MSTAETIEQRPQPELPGASPPLPVDSLADESDHGAVLPWPLPRGSLAARLFEHPYEFDFFQAVWLLERLEPDRAAVGRQGSPAGETVHFAAHPSLSFPPSSVCDLRRDEDSGIPRMTVAFLGLTGPAGALPRHYSELLLRVEREARSPERHALRDWLDLFNHRLVSLFFRAWEKYRFYVPVARGGWRQPEPDLFTEGLFSLIGMGLPSLRGKLSVWQRPPGLTTSAVVSGRRLEPASRTFAGGVFGAGDLEAELSPSPMQPRKLAAIEDLALLYYAGLFVQRPRTATNLQALVSDYFQLPAQVLQFQGQWLRLEPSNQSRLGGPHTNSQLGINAVVGQRVWDVQSKFRIRIGPLDYRQFVEFLPERSASSDSKSLFLLSHLVRLYAGPEFDFDVQVVLKADQVPAIVLNSQAAIGSRLGWNTWLRSLPPQRDAQDAVFAGDETYLVD